MHLEKKVDIPLLASIVAVGVVTIARETPEEFPLGSEMGDVVFDLGIAYVSAWLFHLLIVRLPEYRRRRAFIADLGPELAGLSDVGRTLQRQLEDQSNTDEQPFPASHEIVTTMCEQIQMHAPSGMLRWPPDEEEPKALTWSAFLRSTSDLSARLQRDLAALYPFMDDELVLLLQSERKARLHKHLGLFNARQMGDNTLAWAATEITEYLEISAAIEAYRKRQEARYSVPTDMPAVVSGNANAVRGKRLDPSRRAD